MTRTEKTLAAIILIGLLGVFLAAKAHSAPPENRTPIVQAAPSTQADFDRTADWLSKTLRAAVPRREVVVSENLVNETNAGEAHTDGRIWIRPYIAEGLHLRVGETFGGVFYAGPVQVVVHEILHRQDVRACWHPKPGELNVEEGIVDALTVDLVPAWGWKFWRQRIAAIPYYKAEVAAIRAASAKATSSSSWRSTAARQWRRALWAASCEGREKMLSAVNEEGK